MSSQERAEDRAKQAIRAVAEGAAITYASAVSDKDYPAIQWAIYGIPATNEIVVVARAGVLQLGLSGASGLLVPCMADRVFGIDLADQQLANDLSDRLWAYFSTRLIEAAERQAGR